MLTSTRLSLLLIILAACGGKTLEPLDDAGVTDASTKPDGSVTDAVIPPKDALPPPPPPPPLDGGDCNALQPMGKTVAGTQVAQDPPPFAGTGQTFANGNYLLTGFTIWTGPNGPSGSAGSFDALLRIESAKTGWTVDAVADVNQSVSRSTSTMESSGQGVVVITGYCPSASPAQKALYTFDGSTLVFRFIASSNESIDETYVWVSQ
jgi:hypothetical protein